VAANLVYSPLGGAFVICFLCGGAAQVLGVVQLDRVGYRVELERGCCRECGELLVQRLGHRRGRKRGRLIDFWIQPSFS
jgi:hypothetical protein